MKVAIAGASGRMGRALIEGVLAGAACGVRIADDARQALAGCDVLVDFTRPEGTMAHLEICRAGGVRFVIGTTGFDDAQKLAIAEAARTIPIAMAPNFSVGVNVMFKLLDV